ncbi:aspartate aminotransferase AspC [Alicycliphilus sp. B1]|nr:aspartate aminotransferase AspC [Alicycliphilus sp. B1]
MADEVYERLYYVNGAAAAPSFLDIAQPEDRLIVIGSFSKSFLMTGWRLGWLVAPPEVVSAMGKLIEFNTSCAPVFVQRAGMAALAGAECFLPSLVTQLKHCRDTLIARLAVLPGVTVASPQGGMYAFFRIDGYSDSLALARQLVAEHGLGLAPGAAFGEEGEGWLRWCFASSDPARLSSGVGRLAHALEAMAR